MVKQQVEIETTGFNRIIELDFTEIH